MSTDIVEPVDGGIRVRQTDGAFQRVETPEGFTDFVFRNAVTAFDATYRFHGKLPSVDEVHKFWPRIPVRTYSALFLTEEFKQALAVRGIDWEPDNGLSMEMSMALIALSDPTDRRSTNVKLKEMAIPYSRFQNWMQNPLFAQSYSRRAEATLKGAAATALNKLVGNMEAGDQRAIEKVLEITGRWNPAQQQLEDAKTVIVRVIESVIKNVPDPATRKAIMDDVQREIVSYDLTHQQTAIEG